jgi:hypothetical protein
MNTITPIIEAEATKRINEYIQKGSSIKESTKMALDKVKEIRKSQPLIVIHWEIEKALVIKLSELK